MLRFILGYLLGSVSLLTLTAISVDRLLALLLGLRYRQVVTLKRTYLILAVIWVISTLAAVISLWNDLITTWYGYIGISLCLVISSFSYSIIFWKLRQHQTQLHVQTNAETSPLNVTRYKRAVASALWLQLALITCYLPYEINYRYYIQSERSHPISFSRCSMWDHFNLLKFSTESHSLLLEDR